MRLLALVFLVTSTVYALDTHLGLQRKSWVAGKRYLVVEILSDNLAHFELAEIPGQVDPLNGIYITPMVDAEAYKKYRGPKAEGFKKTDTFIETSRMRIDVEGDSSCVKVTNRRTGAVLTRVCGDQLDGELTGSADGRLLKIERREMENVYGIGNLFQGPKQGGAPQADGDWIGRRWEARNHGNFRFGPHRPKDLNEQPRDDSFYGGGPSVSQFPVMFALGKERGDKFDAYALFLDSVYRTSWYFDRGDEWLADTWGDQLRWFVLVGDDLGEVRRDFMQLTGRPPVPPKSTFGLWISKFGYNNWAEIDRDLTELSSQHFPVDGVALDLQWFGGTFGEPSSGRMGEIWFGSAFDKPEENVARFREDYGVRFMPIEESYVDKRVSDFGFLEKSRYLVMLGDHSDRSVNLTRDIKKEGGGNFGVWWGTGSMMDWSNGDGARYWHQKKRMRLAKLGINNHWLDLGEPEMYYEYGFYAGLPRTGKHDHGSINNVYNLLWAKSIADGYRDPQNQAELKQALGLHEAPRFFILARSGAIGGQKYGAMWSGDVGKNRANYVSHENTQMHMSMAGMDYYGSDAGGFLGGEDPSLEGNNDDELFTQWYSNNSLSSIPLRPHRWCLNENINTPRPFGPHHNGHDESNLANTLQRYELVPYYYSLAHRAHVKGEPIIPPLFYHFPADRAVREMGSQKMLGDKLMFALALGYGQVNRDVYFPKGKWFNYHSGEVVDSRGEKGEHWPLYRERNLGPHDVRPGLFTTPLFARAGAIVPKMYVDDKTRNASMRRAIRTESLSEEERQAEERHRTGLHTVVFADRESTSFEISEDDGETIAYEKGAVRKTVVTQSQDGGKAVVKFAKALQAYESAPTSRTYAVELVLDRVEVDKVLVNGEELGYCGSRRDFELAKSCWFKGYDPRFFSEADKKVRNTFGNHYIPNDNRVFARSAQLDVARGAEFQFILGGSREKRASAYFVCGQAETAPGESIYVTGNVAELGNWNESKAVRLLPVRYEHWRRHAMVVYNLPPSRDIQWKCFKRRESGGPALRWDSEGENHRFNTVPNGYSGTQWADFK